ncbi:MAG: lysophospholipase [Syntrophales bacterium]|jgi:alpha-beta hydrolase superfamily lysophospholipase|nr:lysophospholipase [Syntrophales bacterium]MCK9527981.1 lysophospholipase [Syntrophales bacterium]MDX9921442.1 alpha/beta hydrolase [Syntrophales bacterium]
MDMRTGADTFKSHKGQNIYYRSWLPDDEPRAVLLIVHGLAEHSGRYGNLVNHFAPRGYALYGPDHIGHGKSDGTRVFVERFDDFIRPLNALFRMIRQWHPGKPVYLVGHSMGGLIAVIYLIENPEDMAGAILSAPAVKIPERMSSFAVLAAMVLSNLFPKIGIMELDSDGISRDNAVVYAYRHDPLVYRGKITARLGTEMYRAMQRVASQASAIATPLLILQGSADRMVSPEGARTLYEKAGTTDKRLKLYDGLYHEVFNEPEYEEIMKEVERWLAMR